MDDDLALARAIVSAARDSDPSIEPALGLVLAQVCLAHWRNGAGLTAPELARIVLRQLPDARVSWVNVIATTTVTFGRALRGHQHRPGQ